MSGCAGESALEQLKRLPLDELKIDKSFVMNLETERDEAIVRASIELAHQFGLTVIAEGVESAEVLERLRALSCEGAQGYYISRSLIPNDFADSVCQSREAGARHAGEYEVPKSTRLMNRRL